MSEIQHCIEDFSNFFLTDTSKQAKIVEDVIDESLTRLEEFEGVLEMIKGRVDCDALSCIIDKKSELIKMGEQVSQLEAVVARVKRDVDKLEGLVIDVENETKYFSEGGIINFFKPFFTKNKSEPVTSPVSSSTLPAVNIKKEIPVLFKTEELFEKKEKT